MGRNSNKLNIHWSAVTLPISGPATSMPSFNFCDGSSRRHLVHLRNHRLCRMIHARSLGSAGVRCKSSPSKIECRHSKAGALHTSIWPVAETCPLCRRVRVFKCAASSIRVVGRYKYSRCSGMERNGGKWIKPSNVERRNFPCQSVEFLSAPNMSLKIVLPYKALTVAAVRMINGLTHSALWLDDTGCQSLRGASGSQRPALCTDIEGTTFTVPWARGPDIGV